MLCSLLAQAGDGLVVAGADIILLPSSRWDGDIEWKAWTWVYNSGVNYGDGNTDNLNYNEICGTPFADTEGREWFEPGFDMGPKFDEYGDPADVNFDVTDEDGMPLPIYWEEQTAPFSSDDNYNGRPSYRWTTNSIMADIYARRTFTTDRLLSGPVYLACGHDDAPCEYYINGELVFQRTGEETDANGNIKNGWNNDEFVQLTDEQKALIKTNGEENIIAFHVHQNWGGAFADCGLYTKVEGGLEMGYVQPWEGKVIFNNYGGYGSDHNVWSPLYEAQEGDEYTVSLVGSSDGFMEEVLQFKTPIKIEADHDYIFQVRLLTDKTINNAIIQLSDNNNEDIELAYEEAVIVPPYEGEEDYEGTLVELEFNGSDPGEDINNLNIIFDFGGGEDSTTVVIKDMSLKDVSVELEEEKELWIGTQYFNYTNMTKTVLNTRYLYWDETLNDGAGDYREAVTDEEKELSDVEEEEEILPFIPEIKGRVETKAWTQADFDDSMWDDQMMPVGNEGYMSEVQTIWPGGENTNYWIRRNFDMRDINPLLEYQLNVCHDDNYETYVNGHLLQKYEGWTDGKNPKQVHIPARYLNVGKNVIATYIQQNWGGKFYDCGINVTEINYEDCLKQFMDAIAYAQSDTLLTNAMKEDVQAIIDEAMAFYEENKNDAAELRSYARDSIRPKVNPIFAYSADVKALLDTYKICRDMEDQTYMGTALEDALAALDTCATAAQLAPYLTALRDARKATAFERHTEKFVGITPEIVSLYGDEVGDPLSAKYYIYNVGAKNFLGGGEAWGAHDVLEYASNPMLLIQATKEVYDEDGYYVDDEEIEGGVYIETFRPNGAYGEMDFLGWNGFVDVSRGNNVWQIIPVEGKPNVFNIAQYGNDFPDETIINGDGRENVISGGKRYLGLRSGDNAYAPSYYIVDTDCKTPELETNQWMFITREEMLSFVATASEDTPADLTFLIDNPGYDQRLSIDAWIFSGGSVLGRGDNRPNFVLESYNSGEFSNVQDIWPDEYDEALPAGTYMLTVQGYYRDGIEQTHLQNVAEGKPYQQLAMVFAGADEGDYTNNESIPLMPIHIEANKVPGIGYSYAGMQVPGTYSGQPMDAVDQAAREYFPLGLYTNKLVFTISEDDPGHVSIGVYKEYNENRLNGDWIVMDNWRLYYYGADEIDPDAIQEIASDEINKTNGQSKGIYNMLGQRLSKAQRGVNIIGGKKIAVK